MSKRRNRRLSVGGKFNGPALTHMREIAFGHEATLQLHRMERHQEKRDDAALLKAAEEKRARKAARRVELAGRGKA